MEVKFKHDVLECMCFSTLVYVQVLDLHQVSTVR